MIEVTDVSKKFDTCQAVNHVNVSIKTANVFGLLGTNGAGKSTLLRMISGIIRQDAGEILVDGMEVYDNVRAKENIFFISDEPYFFMNTNAEQMGKFYARVFSTFDQERFAKYLKSFDLDKRQKISTFSKGMKKQLILLLGICSGTKYLLCDETFDGLDPVMRQGIKSILAEQMEERGLTPVIASHNLRELEDICDHVGVLHKGGLLLSRELLDMKCNIQKLQCVFKNDKDSQRILKQMKCLKAEQRGSLWTITARGTRDEVIDILSTVDTIFYEVLPLSLEEIFINETEVVGYDVKKLLLN